MTRAGLKMIGSGGAFHVLDKSSYAKETFGVTSIPQSITHHGTLIK